MYQKYSATEIITTYFAYFLRPFMSCHVLCEIRTTAEKPKGTAVAQWLRCCATNRKVAGSIPDGVIGILH